MVEKLLVSTDGPDSLPTNDSECGGGNALTGSQIGGGPLKPVLGTQECRELAIVEWDGVDPDLVFATEQQQLQKREAELLLTEHEASKSTRLSLDERVRLLSDLLAAAVKASASILSGPVSQAYGGLSRSWPEHALVLTRSVHAASDIIVAMDANEWAVVRSHEHRCGFPYSVGRIEAAYRFSRAAEDCVAEGIGWVRASQLNIPVDELEKRRVSRVFAMATHDPREPHSGSAIGLDELAMGCYFKPNPRAREAAQASEMIEQLVDSLRSMPTDIARVTAEDRFRSAVPDLAPMPVAEASGEVLPEHRITLQQAAKAFNVTEKTLRTAVKKEKLKDLRKPGLPKNAQIILDRRELEGRYELRKPVVPGTVITR